jgi:hypothetical protein
MMQVTRTSETSVDIQSRTWLYIPEDSELHPGLSRSVGVTDVKFVHSFCRIFQVSYIGRAKSLILLT